MIIPKTSNSEQLADILGVVVDDYLERRTRGEHPEIEAIARQHPELADVIRQSLRALEVVGDTYSSGGSVSHETDFGREKRLGDFRILNELGRGGMGVVYVAEQISMGGRKVALKILPFAGIVDQKQLQRFRNEVRAAASLDHPNIVAVYSFGEERGIHFYAMQLIHGQNLATVIDQLRELRRQALPLSGSSLSDVLSASTNNQPATGNTEPTEDLRVEVEPLRDAQVGSHSPGSDTVVEVQGLLSTKGSPRLPEYFRSVAELGIQAAEALEHAHQQGVVHRDIKPANLMLDANAKLVITDFGLAQMEENVGITMTGDIVGTLRYMSPEQALGNRITIDHRADIYSLGVSLYELLTIEPAFDGATRVALLKQVAFQEPRSLRQIDRTIPRDLETIIHKAIAKDANDRYSSAQQMADDLKAFRHHQPISARPPSIVDRSRKWAFRNQGLVLATGILMLLTTIGLVISNTLIAAQRNAAQAASDGEKKQREEAVKQSEIANAIKNFLLDDLLIGAASGTNNPHTMTIDQAVDKVAMKLDDRFSQQPHIRERLRMIIGIMYCGMGKYEKAEPFVEKALEYQRSVIGKDDPDTRKDINLLSMIYGNQGKFERAASILKENHDYLHRTVGDYHPTTLAALKTLASLRGAQMRFVESNALYEQCLGISSEVNGGESHETLRIASRLAQGYFLGSRHQDSKSLAEKYLSIAERVLGKKKETTCRFMQTLADLEEEKGRYADANAIREQIIEASRSFRDPEHPITLEFQAVLADGLRRQGKYVESATQYDATIESMKRAQGETHPATLASIRALSVVYISLDEYRKAEDLLLECLESVQSQFTLENVQSLGTMTTLAQVYLYLSKYEQAQSMLEQILASSVKAYGDEYPTSVEAKSLLARTYLYRDMLNEAEPLLLETFNIFTQQVGKEHPVTLGCMRYIGQLYMRKGDYAKAITFLAPSLAERKRTVGGEHPDVPLFMTDLANTYLKTGQVDLATPLFNEALVRSRKAVGYEHSTTLSIMFQLADFYLAIGERDKALPLFLQALQAQRKLLGGDHASTLSSAAGLGRYYLDQGQLAQAEPVLTETLEARRRVLGKEHSDTLTSMDDLAQLMVVQKKHVEAEDLLRECLALREVKHPDRWMTFRTRSLLGTALLGQKKFAEAEPFIIDGCAGLKRREDKIPFDERCALPDSIQRAVDLYTAWDRPADAQKWQNLLQPPTLPAE